MLPNWLLRLTQIDDVRDVLLYGTSCLIDRGYGLESVRSPFSSSEKLSFALVELAFENGARLDIASPMLDLSLGKLRLHFLLPHGVSSEPSLSVRVHRDEYLLLDNLIAANFLNREQAEILTSSVSEKRTIAISGPTSSGKTTLLRALLSGTTERIITIEQVAELFLPQPAISLIARPSNQEGVGEIGLSELVTQALRMRPDRIVVGEVRKDEFFAFLQAVSNGHPGSLTTFHSTSARQIPQRLIILGLLSGISAQLTMQLVASCIDLFVQLERSESGRRLSVLARLEVEGDQLRLVSL
jgi:pilus assembly protein CpaF